MSLNCYYQTCADVYFQVEQIFCGNRIKIGCGVKMYRFWLTKDNNI